MNRFIETKKEARHTLSEELKQAEAKLVTPKAGQLWKIKSELGYLFWIDESADGPYVGMLNTANVGVRFVMVSNVEYDDHQYLQGIGETRWEIRVFVGERIGYSRFTSIMEWHKDFERV